MLKILNKPYCVNINQYKECQNSNEMRKIKVTMVNKTFLLGTKWTELLFIPYTST